MTEHSENDFQVLKNYLVSLFDCKCTYDNTTKVFYALRALSRFEGIIDVKGNLTTPQYWYELSEEQSQFFGSIKAISNLSVSYTDKATMIKRFLASF
jgi:hypothetical protein